MWLNRAAGASLLPNLPSLALFTDDLRLPDPLAAIGALPRGSLVVLRARDNADRARLAGEVAPLARRRSLVWIVAGDAALAARMGAQGLHLAEAEHSMAMHWRTRRPGWLITCAAHSLAACARAERSRADAVFLAPIFPTQSHPGGAALGPCRAQAIARCVNIPVYALGGVDAQTARRLAPGALAGLAAIGALAV
jgi:thiamine-phosphate pyrophosphorylase